MSEYPVNEVFPPDYGKYGDRYHGYKNGDIEAILYDFAVQNYDLEVIYKGKAYYFATDSEGACRCEKPFCIPCSEFFKDGNDLLQNFVLDDGKRIVDVLDEIEHAEPY